MALTCIMNMVDFIGKINFNTNTYLGHETKMSNQTKWVYDL